MSENQVSVIREMSRKVKSSGELAADDKHNIVVMLKIKEWEASRTLKLKSYFALFLILLGFMSTSFYGTIL